jgi:hypothetical protein
VFTTSLFQHVTPQSAHALLCPLVQCSVQHSLGAAWSVSSYDARFQHAHASIHAHALPLSTADSLQLSAQHNLGAAWSGNYYDARCFSMHTPQSRTCIALSCHSRQSVPSLPAPGCSLGREDARCFSMHAPQSTPPLLCPLQIHCSSVQHSLGCSLGSEWLTLVVSACTRLNHACIALSMQIHCSSVQHSLGAAWAWWLRRSVFQHARLNPTHMHLLCPRIHCSSVQHSLGAAWTWWLRRSLFACTRLNPRTCIALSTGFTAVVATQSRVRPGRECYDARCFSMHTPQSTHMHCFVL